MEPRDHHDPLQLVADEQLTVLSPDCLRILAPAKINLNLLVGPLRADGYHPLDSVVSKIAFYDELTLCNGEPGRVTFEAEGLPCGPDADNLAVQAVKLMQSLPQAVDRGVALSLTKRIPPGMGLGGGSSDAAAVLVGLNALWQLGLDRDVLAMLGAQLGSDVPLFLGPAGLRMTGLGECVEPLAIHLFAVLLVMPELHCSTAEVYAAYDRDPVALGEQLPAEVWAQPVDAWQARLRNDLAGPACRIEPELLACRDRLSQAIGGPLHVTGSGAGLFVLCETVTDAKLRWDNLPGDLQARAIVAVQNPW